MDWQPIETMPKDGRPFLVLSPAGHIGIAIVREVEFDGMRYLEQDAAWSGERPHTNGPRVWLGGDKPSNSTHWMPLPNQPEQP